MESMSAAVAFLAGAVTAAIITFVAFYLMQMRGSDRQTIRENRKALAELHEYIAENRKDIAELKRRNRLSGGEGD